MLKEGSECFNPDEFRRIIQAARAGLEGSLTAICMLDDDISLFMHLPGYRRQGAEGALPEHPARVLGVNANLGRGEGLRGAGL
jgi:hypothetical protein